MRHDKTEDRKYIFFKTKKTKSRFSNTNQISCEVNNCTWKTGQEKRHKMAKIINRLLKGKDSWAHGFVAKKFWVLFILV